VDGDYAQAGEYLTCNTMWPLTDFTEENGATRVVPGSHRNGRKIDDDLKDAKDAHPQEIKLTASVGTVIVFNGHLWHGATLNRSDHRRASVTSFWCRRQLPSAWRPLKSTFSPAAASRLGKAAQSLFDLE
jgi:ectoine hydroxylase-related dioxygenase (phytanoyl-CoA dioxygenase family)